MTIRDRNVLLLGLLIGAVIAASVLVGRQYFATRQQPTAAAAAPTSDQGATKSQVPPAADSAPSIQLTDEDQKAIGVETVEVKRQSIRKEISAPGKVAEPETGIGTISARIGGRIEKLFVNVTGETVSRGQPVALIYSPEIFTAGEEYRLALENRQRLHSSKEPQAISEADELIRASKRRLELWGVSAQQIDDLAAAANKTVEIT